MSISKMVWTAEENTTECIIKDSMPFPTGKGDISIQVHPSTYVHQLINDVATKFDIDEDKFCLVYELVRCGDNAQQNEIVLNSEKQKTLNDIGINFEEGARNILYLESKQRLQKNDRQNTLNDECSSDVNGQPAINNDKSISVEPFVIPDKLSFDTKPKVARKPTRRNANCNSTPSTVSGSCSSIGYVGLVNQAMTCYLNSLLQALFMTPEFRNALYNWEFDGKDEVDSIPYQLQKLFLNLQTSTKVAVETTELTRSFGWDSSEAWQQHDIQELCRVMFDALEQKFKNTKQADLINRLYEGKLLDYVKCLECGTDKSRDDTFLDIPLPVRPFGSTVAYGSVEEALRAFVKPETLDGSNQYFCEKCNKKCDAHKGLKFTKFPYLLTLHLKRFDFDYNTLHRIKLNDKVSFPETLNLNSFISSGSKEDNEVDETVVRYDDSSTTDSGSALDEDGCQGNDTIVSASGSGNGASGSGVSSTNNGIVWDYPDCDEGIDVSEGGASSSNHQENEKNKRFAAEPGPYMYELFSIMIHSGSASGGHYYAYIKDFRKGEWFCFNDQSVTKITYDDIRKTYGGGHLRGYYSGAFSSSTNAYMLMYRQIDKERNCDAITVDEFPPHIQELYQKIKEKEDSERIYRENEGSMIRLKVYAHHPQENDIVDIRIFINKNKTLADATKLAHSQLWLSESVPIEQCRLVAYDRYQDTIECSFDGKENETLDELLNGWRNVGKNDFLMEIRDKNGKFEEYQFGSVLLKVYRVDIDSEMVEGPATVRGNLMLTVKEFKKLVAKALDMDPSTLKLAVEKYREGPRILDDNLTLEAESIYSTSRLYATKACDVNPSKQFNILKFNQIIDQFEHVISLRFVLPVLNEELLKLTDIPTLDDQLKDKSSSSVLNNDIEMQNCEPVTPVMPPKAPISATLSNMSDSPIMQRASPLPVEVGSDQSNSEDSSLSDSDRTLVGDLSAPDDEGLAQLSVSSMSPCVSSPDEAKKIEDTWDDLQLAQSYAKKRIHYFKATELVTENKQNKKTRILKTLIDKRMVLAQVKKELEPYVGVPMDYFKVYRHYLTSQESESVQLNEDFKSYNDGEKISIKLGRALRSGEYQGKVYQLIPNDEDEPIKFLCDWIVAKDTKVSDFKRGLYEELKNKYMIDVPYDRFRIRKKSWKYPGKVFLDHEKLDLNSLSNWEIFVQLLDEPEPVQNSDQLIVFVRHWCPSIMELKGYKEIVLDKATTEEFKQKISDMSGIPVEFIELCETKKSFPNSLPILKLHTDPEWISAKHHSDKWFDCYDNGSAYLFRDSREELKELSQEERKRIINKQAAIINKQVSVYTPRRERGLKIYLDSNKKGEEPDRSASPSKTIINTSTVATNTTTVAENAIKVTSNNIDSDSNSQTDKIDLRNIDRNK